MSKKTARTIDATEIMKEVVDQARRLDELATKFGSTVEAMRTAIQSSQRLRLLDDIVFDKEVTASIKSALRAHVLANEGDPILVSRYRDLLACDHRIYAWRIEGIVQIRTKDGLCFVPASKAKQTGPELVRPKRRGLSQPEKRAIGVAARRLFDRTPEAPPQVARKLERLRRSSLVIVIDGSTTNEHIAVSLATLDDRASVTFVTNDRAIHDILLENRGNRPHRVIFIGGVQRAKTETYVGPEAEAFYSALGLIPDVSFIGVSEVSPTGELGSSDFSESRLKRLLLGPENWTLRCVSPTSEKIKDSRGSPWTFAALQSVDVVLSDTGADLQHDFVATLNALGTLLVTEEPQSGPRSPTEPIRLAGYST